MKFNYTLAALICAALTTGCSSETDGLLQDVEQELTPSTPDIKFFAPSDDSQFLIGSPAVQVRTLLKNMDPSVAKGYGEINVTADEVAEIKTFTDELVKNCKTQADTFNTIFNWLYKNIKYEHEYEGGDVISNDPYPVFKERVAICQGFSNLQHIMVESQGIPCLNVNGQYVHVGGHAWNYVYHSKKWWVSDATNNGRFNMMNASAYKHLEPYSIDAVLFETDDCVFKYRDCELNIDSIKATGSQFVVPFSVNGYRVTSLNPHSAVPTNIKEIFIGSNIKTLGEYYHGLEKNAPSIEAAYVDPANKHLASYSKAVYRKNGNEFQLYYLPGSLKSFEVKPLKVIDKNLVFDHAALEEVIIPNGTQEISDYAFEKCPQLRVAYVPEGVKIAEKAFWDVHPDFKVVQKDLTGIPEIRL